MPHLYSQDLYGEETYSQETESQAAGNGAYNEHLYNENVYNAAILVLSLMESISSADNRANLPALPKTELVTLMDNLQRFFNGQILMDILTLPDNLVKTALLAKAETMFLADFKTLSLLKTLLEAMTLSDVRTMVYLTGKVDAVNLADFLSKQITNKRVTETLKLNDWFTIKNSPQSDPWN